MRIFGIVIVPKKNLEMLVDTTRKESFKDGCQFIKDLNKAWVNPVIHDLEKLRANTWDQNKITHMQNWLQGMIQGDDK